MTALAVHNLHKRFGGIEAVADVSFTLAPGELLALIGPNGAGKSTCFNMLNGQLRPDAGRVLLAGPDGTMDDITGLPPPAIWRLGVGRTFQIAASFASMTVRENVQMALLSHHRRIWRVWHAASRHAPHAANALLARVGMAAQADRPAGELAYGDLKRLELAVALANTPRLLLMDEPTAGMAPAERAALMALARTIARTDGMAVLFTEHDMDTVFTTADRILVLNRGTLIAEGTPTEIRANPEVRAVYLGENQA
ncbi:MAG: ABC transporter ATP-binding protein [Acetobacteraceae bacterium]|nr:ABC transporter ATP-binding protein [Acetobacteraceae bacterium]